MLCYKLLRPVLPLVKEQTCCQSIKKICLQEKVSKDILYGIHTCSCIIDANRNDFQFKKEHKNNNKYIFNTYTLYFSSDQKPPITKLVGRQDVLRKVLQDKQNRLHQTELRIRKKGKLLLQDIRETKSKMKEKMDDLHQTELKIRKSGKLIMKDIRETKTKMKEKMEEIIERENVMTIPNLLCVTRIALSPYLGYLIVNHDFEIALGIVAFAGITDLLDGWIARTFKNQSSKLGSFLDPMADKVLIATMFLTLTYADIIPVPLTSLIITRDVLLVAAGFYIRYQSLPPPKTLSRYFDVTHATAQLAPTTISKVNTMVQLATVACTLAAPVFNYLEHPALHALWYLTAGTTVASALSYILSKNTYKFLKDNKR